MTHMNSLPDDIGWFEFGHKALQLFDLRPDVDAPV